MRDQGKTTLLYLMRIQKECIVNTRKFESGFGRRKHGCAYIAMGNQQYDLHYNIAFVPPRKTGLSQTYKLNPTQGNISVVYQSYQKNLHEYHLVKKMNSTLKKIFIAAINEQWIKWAKDMVVRYANKYFVEMMNWIYDRYGQITPGDLMNNQNEIQATYNIGDLIEIMFDQMYKVQE